MKEDPIIAEVRAVREAHAAKFNYDIAAICADLKRMEKCSERKKPAKTAKTRQPKKAA